MPMRICVLALVWLLATPSVTAASLAEWDYAPLRDDVRASALLTADVLSDSEHPMGAVRNVMIDRDGKLKAASISFNHAGTDAQALALVEWSKISVGRSADEVTISLGMADKMPAAYSEPLVQDVVGVRALLGVPVRLGEEHFGEVDDLLLEIAGQEVSAMIVETNDGEEYALPVPKLTAFEKEGWLLYPDFSAAQVRDLGEFN